MPPARIGPQYFGSTTVNAGATLSMKAAAATARTRMSFCLTSARVPPDRGPHPVSTDMLRPALPVVALLLILAGPATATPVCTDGYMGGPPASQCGGRIFPE